MKMKRIVFFALVFMAFGYSIYAQQLTVAVSPFEARSGMSKDDAETVTELFIAQLVADRTIKVVDRNNFDKIIAEMRFQSSDWADSNRVAELGRATGANSIIRGTVATLAGQTVITATILDINTAQILSSSTLRMANMREIFDKLPTFASDIVTNLPKRVYKIGDIGPGEGIIFFAEGGLYKECSGELGSYYWNSARVVAQNHRGGSFTNWRLPDRRELDLMYRNLKLKGLGGFSNRGYWSSEQLDEYKAWAWNFSNGTEDFWGKNDTVLVRAVRSFNQ